MDDPPRSATRNRLTRRELLRLGAAVGLAPLLPTIAGCGDSGREAGSAELPEYAFDGIPGPAGLFAHGVASGDPVRDAVILWTRVSVEDADPVEVFWEVARDPAFTDRVGAGWVETGADRDFTVKLDATGLGAESTYYYRFQCLGRTSPIGRTRTAGRGSVDRLRLAFASCSSLTNGYFHAYRDIAQRPDLDLVVHLGDYIYENGGSGVRAHEPAHELLTLQDYRQRHAQYKSDPDLQEAHRQHPFVTVWDDHESCNNAWRDGASSHNDETEGDWPQRRAIAERVYSEWMPLRDQDDGRVFRHLAFGDLVDLLVLDTRLWGRDRQVDETGDVEALRNPSRTILGFDQEEWLADRLASSRARWVLAGQQVMLSPWKLVGAPESQGGGLISNTDAWDGYFAARSRLLQSLRDAGDPNFLVLTGDIHSSWVFDITEDPSDPAHYDPGTGRGSQGVEFVAPGVTSGFVSDRDALRDLYLDQNPHLHWGDIRKRGYGILDLTPDRAVAAWYHVDDVTSREGRVSLAKVFAVEIGTNHAVPQEEPPAPRADSSPLAP